MKITKQNFRDMVGTRFFTVTFRKADGTTRKMQGRLGVHKGVKGTGRLAPDHIVTVYEVTHERDDKGRFCNVKGQWRSFDINRLETVNGKDV